MFATWLDLPTIVVVIVGALVAGFTTGFAGFGTGLIASGLWFHALPSSIVPPLVAFASIVGLITVRKAFDWRRATPYLIGGVFGIPLGVAALTAASPLILKGSVGVFLIAYGIYQLAQRRTQNIGSWGGRIADGVVGLGGGFLGGFVGLAGPLPLIWLQLRGGPSDRQRAVYQPFNLIVLALASIGMAIGGQIKADVLWTALLCLPAALVGAFVGARIYVGVPQQIFQRVVLCLLLVSGFILVAHTVLAR
jgi:uncharacterized membrane protein YfcA